MPIYFIIYYVHGPKLKYVGKKKQNKKPSECNSTVDVFLKKKNLWEFHKYVFFYTINFLRRSYSAEANIIRMRS